jgi:folate-binding protein YgfZ
MTSTIPLADRALFEIRGEEARNFLQGLITNDIRKLAPDTPLYAALLTPQGKVLSDFLLYARDESILLDCALASASDLKTRLTRYRLRARVEITLREDVAIVAHWNGVDTKAGSWRDPRHPALGWRAVVNAPSVSGPSAADAYLEHRLGLGIPEGADFGSDRMFAFDADLDELHGVSFDKGCYVGQELTARMKHRGTARKRLLPVDSDEPLPVSDTPITAAERELGVITSTYGRRGFATVRLDRLAEAEGVPLQAAGIGVRVRKPAWLSA